MDSSLLRSILGTYQIYGTNIYNSNTCTDPFMRFLFVCVAAQSPAFQVPFMTCFYFALPSFSCHLLNVSCAVAILSPILASSSYFSHVAAFSIHCKYSSQFCGNKGWGMLLTLSHSFTHLLTSDSLPSLLASPLCIQQLTPIS